MTAVWMAMKDESGLKPEINVGEKFSCIGLQNAIVEKPLCFDDQFIFTSQAPMPMAEYWRTWHGSLLMTKFEESKLFLISRTPSQAIGAINDEDRDMEWGAMCLFYSCVLHGLRTQDEQIPQIGGFRSPSTFDANSLTISNFYRAPHSIRSLKRDDLRSVADVARTLRDLYATQGKYERLGRGFRAWVKGIASSEPDDRLHQFARSVEALVKPKQGKSTKQFANRCQTFIGAGEGNRQLMKDIYDLRSQIEHMNSLQAVVPDDRTGALRVFQIETLASRVYSCILTSHKLLVYFESDSKIDRFWALPSEDRLEYWGLANVVDLRSEEESYFHWDP